MVCDLKHEYENITSLCNSTGKPTGLLLACWPLPLTACVQFPPCVHAASVVANAAATALHLTCICVMPAATTLLCNMPASPPTVLGLSREH